METVYNSGHAQKGRCGELLKLQSNCATESHMQDSDDGVPGPLEISTKVIPISRRKVGFRTVQNILLLRLFAEKAKLKGHKM